MGKREKLRAKKLKKQRGGGGNGGNKHSMMKAKAPNSIDNQRLNSIKQHVKVTQDSKSPKEVNAVSKPSPGGKVAKAYNYNINQSILIIGGIND